MSTNTEQLIAWLRLSRLELAPRKALALADAFDDPRNIFTAKMTDLATISGLGQLAIGKVLNSNPDAANKDIELLEKSGISVLTIKDEDYPANLKQIYDPPVVMYVRGELKESDRFAIAIVGSRTASEYGRTMAHRIASEVASRGLTIVSGGARGIDTFAHRGALSTGGRTVAVLGCGVDVAYPYENKSLFAEVAQRGAVIAESPLGSKPDPWRFPARNRVISGLSRGVLVVEGREDSGSLITANFAAEHGRDVFALPGGVDKEASRAPHKLIKEGARLVESAQDILEELGIEVEPGARAQLGLPIEGLTPAERKMVELVDLQPKHVDEIIRDCGLPSSEVSSMLTLLEMRGFVRRVPGNAYVRAI